MADCYEGGEGPPLVLLHGLGGSWGIWRPVLPMLEKRYRVLALTLPGHPGGEIWPPGRSVGVDGLVDLVAADLARRGWERPHIAGNSLGGWIALELARRNLAASVTALSPAGAWLSVADYRAVSRPFRIVHALMPLLITVVGPLLRSAGARRALNAQAMEHGDRMSREEVLGAMRSLGGTKILPQLLNAMEREGPMKPFDASAIPITIAWGEHDKVIPFAAYGAPMLKTARGAQAATLRGCGHAPMYDAPDEVAAAILRVTSRAT